jgi:hypothetical protein
MNPLTVRRDKAPVFEIAIAMTVGHSSVTTTEIYLHRDVTELASGQDRLPPVRDDANLPAAI